ncbi:hypothetical protein ACNOYE_17210 [Nannocystaceae bacterium ST9]
MLTEPERITMFATVLRERFGLDPEVGRESEDWWRFEVEGVTFQGGVHSVDVRVLATVCAMSASVDIDAVYEELGKTSPVGLARFIEADCYLYATAKASFAEVSADRIEQMIRDCVAAAKSSAGSSLRSKWRDW